MDATGTTEVWSSRAKLVVFGGSSVVSLVPASDGRDARVRYARAATMYEVDAGKSEDASRAVAPICASHHPGIAARQLSDSCAETPTAAVPSASAPTAR